MKFEEFRKLHEASHQERTSVVDGWQVIATSHGAERDVERFNQRVKGGIETILKRTIKKIEALKNPREAETMVRSMSMDQSIVLNVDPAKKQFRIITILPKGKHIVSSEAKGRTMKIIVEGKEVDCTDYIEIE